MPLARTLLAAVKQSGTGASGPSNALSTGSVATTTGATLVAIGSIQKEDHAGVQISNLTIANSGTALVWTPTVVVDNSPAYGAMGAIWTAPVPAGATINITMSSAFPTFGLCLAVFQYTGQGGFGAKVATIWGDTGDGPQTITLDGTPAATSEVIGARIAACQTTGVMSATPAANHTELGDQSVDSAMGQQIQVQNAGFNSATFAWADIDAAPSDGGLYTPAGMALEIKAAATAPTLGNVTSASTGVPATSQACAWPSGLQAGDIVGAFYMSFDGGTPVITGTGWTQIDQAVTSNTFCTYLEHVATGAESGNFTLNCSVSAYPVVIAWRVIGGVRQALSKNSGSGTTLTATGVTTTEANELAVMGATTYNAQAQTGFPGWTFQVQEAGNNNLFQRTVASAGAFADSTATVGFNDTWATVVVAYKSGSGGAPAGVALAGQADGVATTTGALTVAQAPRVSSSLEEHGTSLGATNAQVLPTGAAAGDLVIYVVGVDLAGGATAITASTGWTAITNAAETQGTTVINSNAFMRVLDGTTGSNICSITGAAQDYVAIGILIKAGDHAVTTAADIVCAGTTNTTGNVDPPNVNPAVFKRWLWLACAIIDLTTGNTITAMPSGYVSVQNLVSASSTSSVAVAVARRGSLATSENPGTFTGSASTRPWIGLTLAIPPPVSVVALVGRADGLSTTTGDLTVTPATGGGPVALAGGADGVSTATGTLSVARALAGSAAGVATTVADLTVPSWAGGHTYTEPFTYPNGRLPSPWIDDTFAGGPGHMAQVVDNQVSTVNDIAWYTAIQQVLILNMTGDWQMDFDCYTSNVVSGGGAMLRALNPVNGQGYGVFCGNAVHVYKFDGVGGETYMTNWGRPSEGVGFSGAHITLIHTAAGHFEAYINGAQPGGGSGLSNCDNSEYVAGNVLVLSYYSASSPTRETTMDNVVVRDFIAGPPPPYTPGPVALVGTSDGASTASGTLAVARAFAGRVDGVSTVVNAPLVVDRAFVGRADGVSTAVATAMAVNRGLVGRADGLSTVAGDMTSGTTVAMTASAAGTSSATGTLSVERGLAGRADGTSGTTAAIGSAVALAGRSDGVGSALAPTLAVQRALAGTSDGLSTAVATRMTAAVGLAGRSDGHGDANGDMTQGGKLISGFSDGVGGATGTLSVARSLAGRSDGLSMSTGDMSRVLALGGRSDGVATAVGTVGVTLALAGRSDGASGATGVLVCVRAMAGRSDGHGTAQGSTISIITFEGGIFVYRNGGWEKQEPGSPPISVWNGTRWETDAKIWDGFRWQVLNPV